MTILKALKHKSRLSLGTCHKYMSKPKYIQTLLMLKFPNIFEIWLDNNKNKIILEATLNYIKVSESFSGSLFED